LRDDDTLWLIPGDRRWVGVCRSIDSVVTEKDFPWLRQQDPSNPKLPELPKQFPYRQRFIGRAEAATAAGEGRGQRAQKLDENENPLRNPRPAKARRGLFAHALWHQTARRAFASVHAAG